ncbi:MAG: ATP-binding cassette domain-containing protein [Thermoleophilaceae bacterium]
MSTRHDQPVHGAPGTALSIVAEGREIVATGPVTVGCDAAADLRLDDPRVEGVHLRIDLGDGGWTVRDASARGTFVGGARILECAVSEPLIVRLGSPGGPAIELRPLARERAATQGISALDEAQTAPPGRAPKDQRRLGKLSGVHQTLTTSITIGRAPDNGCVVDDLLASRHHARMTLRHDGRWELVDLDSDNGTFVNGRRIESVILEDLDVVTVGHHAFRLVGSRLEEYVDEGEVTFEAIGLTVRTDSGRLLLDDVTFSLDERALLALVGPSGAGKSTLLNALTGFRPAQHGTVMYGGRDLYGSYDELRTRIGFVPQQDVVHDPLTVREALSYAAELRFPADVPGAERERRVDEVIDELGLSDVRHTLVADLSGGQRRRVCVGLELITKPSLIFLDEPTSGLDPGYERDLMQLLRTLADGGRTIVVATHSVQSLRLCDRVLFLAPGGRPAYFGPAQLAPAYFGRDDFQEVFRDLSTHQDHDWSAAFREHPYFERYVATRRQSPADRTPSGRRAVPRLPNPRHWLSQFAMLTRRYARVVTSDRRNLALLVLQPVLLGLLMLAALPAGELGTLAEGELRVVSRAGLVLLVVVLGATWLGASNAIREIVKEQAIFLRERAVGLSVSAYVWSKALVLGAVTVLQSAVLAAIALARQDGPAEGSLLAWPLGELMLAAALAGLAGMSLGLLVSAIARSVDRAMTILPVVLIVEMLLAMGGLFPDLVDKPVLKQASYVAGTQWGFSATASTVDLDRLQSVDRVARELPSVRLEDPLPVLRALSDTGDEGERRWRHDWPTWLLDAGVLLALTLAGILAAMAALWRRRPEA